MSTLYPRAREETQTLPWGFNRAGIVTRARDLRRNETQAESCLWNLLRNRQLHNFKFRRQHQFGGYIVDFYCHEAQLVIECDGSIHETNENWQHDQARDAYMAGYGLRVLRFTNEEVLNDTQGVLRKIAEFLVDSNGDASTKIKNKTRLRPSLTLPKGGNN